ncbi:MAG: AAA family ATPase [Deltaproteobacteria bacterium]
MKEIAAGSGLAMIIFMAIIGLNVTPVLLLVALAVAFYLFAQSQGGIKFMQGGESVKVGAGISFADIGGQQTAIQELKEALQFIVKAEEIGQMGIRPLKGILLVGPPGTGKTLLARAAATLTSSIFLSASGSEFVEMYAGVGAKRVRQLFRDARKKASGQKAKSAIIFIDELEVLGAKRGTHNSHMEYDQTLNQLLVEMDGIEGNHDPRILVIAATNRADMLDPALVRPGRFDRQVQVGLPDRTGRRQILGIHTRNKPVANPEVLDEIAQATFGFSGAHLESLANEAAILALREDAATIENRHFSEAINKVILGEKLERKPSVEEIKRVAVHESGHAIVSEMLYAGSVSSLTIVPRGRALGFMRKSPQDDQYLYTREELERQIMVMLGGAVAEEIRFGNRSTGASSDFDQAWQTARQIVEAGLSGLGIVKGEHIPERLLFEECQQILFASEEQTRDLLNSNTDILYSVTEAILEEESMERERFQELFSGANLH